MLVTLTATPQLAAVPAACLTQPNFTLPNTALPWACFLSTPSGTSCNTGCAAGYAGGYATQCFQGAWQTPTGSCTAMGAWQGVRSRRFDAIQGQRPVLSAWQCCCCHDHAPALPGQHRTAHVLLLLLLAGCSTLSNPNPANTLGWPTNCTTVPSLPAGSSCPAACKAGLTGGVTATCAAGGSWNISGACGEEEAAAIVAVDAGGVLLHALVLCAEPSRFQTMTLLLLLLHALFCVAANCSVQLSPPAGTPAAVCYGTTALNADYAFTAASAQSTVFAAAIAGGSCTPPAGEWRVLHSSRTRPHGLAPGL